MTMTRSCAWGANTGAPAQVHKEIYDHVAALRAGRPFDYELSLDETPESTPPRDLLFYLVLLQGMGVPERGIASAGPNIGFIKRHDYEGDLHDALARRPTPAPVSCASCGAMLSVHSADGVRADYRQGAGRGRGAAQRHRRRWRAESRRCLSGGALAGSWQPRQTGGAGAISGILAAHL